MGAVPSESNGGLGIVFHGPNRLIHHHVLSSRPMQHADVDIGNSGVEVKLLLFLASDLTLGKVSGGPGLGSWSFHFVPAVGTWACQCHGPQCPEPPPPLDSPLSHS